MMPRLILQPGIRAPEFALPAVNSLQKADVGGAGRQVSVLLFFAAGAAAETGAQLAGYQERLREYEARNARIIGVTDAAGDELGKLAADGHIEFPLAGAGPAKAVAQRYGAVVDGAIRPAVFVIDPDGLIRRVFQPEPDEGLPNPASVLRAVTNLASVPVPPAAAAGDWRLGSPVAPVVIIEYGDYQCKHCRELFRVILRLMPAYENKLQFIFRHFPMRHAHPLAILAAQAAEAAGVQGKFWEMHARLFAADNALEREKLLQYAGELGLNLEKFSADLDSAPAEKAVMGDYHEAVKHRIKSAPTLFFNYILFDGAPTEENVRSKIDGLLACNERVNNHG